jgi:hypothetical protein
MNAVDHSTRRPASIWIICGCYLLSGGLSLLSQLLVRSGNAPLNSNQRAFFEQASILLFVNTIVAVLMIIASVLLYRLSKMAVTIFGCIVVATVARDLVQFRSYDMTVVMGRYALLWSFLGFAVVAGVFLYTVQLQKRRILN